MLMVGKLGGALALSVVLWLSVDWPAAVAVLAGADALSLLAAFAASVATILLSARKWQVLLRGARIRLAYATTAQLYWIGSFFSNFLPTGVGGDAVRLLLTPAPGDRGGVAATILVERISGLFLLLALSAAALAILPLKLGFAVPTLTCAAGLFVLALAVLAILYLPAWFLAGLFSLEQVLPGWAGRPLRLAQRLVRGVIGRGMDRRAVTGAILYSVPFYAAMMLAQYWMLRSVGAEVAPLAVILGAPLVSLVALTPITINGLFLAEGAFVLIYASAGVQPEVALAAAIVRRMVDLANSGLGSFLWLAWHVGLRGGGATGTGRHGDAPTGAAPARG
jgi:glycosyltransferase 2 family protein